MKIHAVSDLHLEFHQKRDPVYTGITPADADVLVIAGDIAVGSAAIAYFAHWPVPVVYVAGNHEFYGDDICRIEENLRRESAGTSIHFLERDEVVISGVRFLGTTLWTDYLLYGQAQQRKAMFGAESQLNDHKLIRLNGQRFLAEDAMQQHVEAKKWLAEKLNQPFEGQTVVVTHHAPDAQSVHPRFAADLLSAAFASDLSPLMGSAQLWLHGHVHDSFDYTVNSTRVIANPRGYPRYRGGFENAAFDPGLVVEV